MAELLIHAAGWIPLALAGAAAWLAVAFLLGVIVGRAIRNRDRQIPRDKED